MDEKGYFIDAGHYKALQAVEKKAQALVDGMEKFPDVSAQLLGLKAVLKPAEPEYVPLLSDAEMHDAWSDCGGGMYDSYRAVEALTLRKAADRLEAEELRARSEANAVVLLRRWADQEEKYNA